MKNEGWASANTGDNSATGNASSNEASTVKRRLALPGPWPVFPELVTKRSRKPSLS